MPTSREPAPDYIPKSRRKQWEAIYASAYDSALADGKSEKESASSAFAQATGTIERQLGRKVAKKQKADEQTPEQKQAERVNKLRLMLAELPKLPEFARRPARMKIERKARKWGIGLAEFAGAEDGGKGGHLVTEESGEKHLPTTKNGKPDHGLMGAAHAALMSPQGFRGQPYSGPGKEEAIKKLKALYKSEGMEWPEDKKEASDSGFATMLYSIDLSSVGVDAFGRQAYRIPVALTGEWVKGQPFSITLDDLEAIKRNFEKRGNGEIVVDYEHASENPPVAQGGPVPAAGWMSGFDIEHVNGNHLLTVLFAPNERGKQLIEGGEYRYLSPAIDWSFKDKKTGEPQGATLTSVALTNHPFLDELPAIQMRETYWSPSAVLLTDLQGGKIMTRQEQIDQMKDRIVALIAEGKKSEARVLLAEAKKLEAQEYTLGEAPKLKLVRMGAKHGLFGGDGKAVGYITDGDMKKHLKACATEDGNDVEPDADEDDKKMREFRASKGLKFSDVQMLVERGQQAIASDREGQRVLMSEAVINGCLDRARAAFSANQHRNITIQDFVAVERADTILMKAVQDGKLVPAHRKELFEDVVANPEKWEKLFASAVPLFNISRSTGVPGSTDGSQSTVQEEVDAKVKQYMTEHKDNADLTYATAMRATFAEDSQKGGTLAKRYEASRAQNKA